MDIQNLNARLEKVLNEVSLETAEKSNDLRNQDFIKKVIAMKNSNSEIDREIAKEAKNNLKKNTELLKKWKKSKGFTK